MNSTPDLNGGAAPADAAEITAPPVAVSRTYVSDHVWMMDVPDAPLRMWLTLRAFVYEKDPASRSVRITDAELAQLMHRTESAVRNIRRRAYALGLLAEESCVQETYRAPNGANRIRTVRRITVLHIDPPEGYSGPTNAYTELRRIRSVSAGRPERQKSDTHGDQGKRGSGSNKDGKRRRTDQGKQGVSAGRPGCQNFDEGRQNFDDPCQKIARSTPAEQGKPAPQVSLPSASNNQPSRAREDSDEGSWLVGDPSGEQPPTAEESGRPGTPGARLLAGLKAADGSRVAAHGVRRHAAVVDAALEVLSSREIIDHLTGGGIRTAGGIVSRISSLADRVEVEARQRAAAAAVRNCGLCDGEGFRYHPDGRHLGPTTTRCDHRPVSDEHAVRSTPPSAPQRPAEGAEEAGDVTASTFRPHASNEARRRAREALAASLARSNPKRVSL